VTLAGPPTTIVQDPVPVQAPEKTVPPDEDVSVTVVPCWKGAVQVPVTPPGPSATLAAWSRSSSSRCCSAPRRRHRSTW
jgi:hypothetical protein